MAIFQNGINQRKIAASLSRAGIPNGLRRLHHIALNFQRRRRLMVDLKTARATVPMLR
jgi:hypothetical protein